jgi:D-alanyl-D-alanine dipeptidase
MMQSQPHQSFVLAWILAICSCAANAQVQGSAPTASGQSAATPTAKGSAAPAKPDANKVPNWREGISPPSKPADAKKELKELVGIYRNGDKREIILLEWVQSLHVHVGGMFFGVLEPQQVDKWKLRMRRNWEMDVAVERDASGKVVALNCSNEDFGRYVRADAGSDPKGFYHVTPAKPIEMLRAEALVAKPPSETGPFQKTELRELTSLDPGFHLDIRYASTNNFLSTAVYEHGGAYAYLQKPAAEALLRVLRKLKPLGYGLLIHDAYRPWYVTKIFWDATPVEGHTFVADPQKGSKHNRGCAVDLTMYDLATSDPVEMPGMYDEMSERSFPEFPGGTWLQRWNRDLLKKAMESEGFAVDAHEWWHFDYKDWKKYPILNVVIGTRGNSGVMPAATSEQEKPH